MSTNDFQSQLAAALAECEKLRQENKRLRAALGLPEAVAETKTAYVVTHETAVNGRSSPEAKIALFRVLFRGREDVFAGRWQNRKGASGYSPACRHEWDKVLCDKRAVKCGTCANREFLPLTDAAVTDHLSGKQTIGIYPLLGDETCYFLAVDFDKESWQQDALASMRAGDDMGIPLALERSRSGDGAHVWAFFDEPIEAHLARQLGSAILTRAMTNRPQIGFASYDRFFPSQDTLPKGGFGNLIALPLQHGPRDKENSVFLNDSLEPYADQWAYLSTVRKIDRQSVKNLVREAAGAAGIIGVRTSGVEETEEDPWTLPPSGKRPEPAIEGPLPKKLKIVVSNLIYVEKAAVPPALLNGLMRLAAFQNPEFYKAQAMRLPTYDKPRIISCSEEFPRHLGLPRGCVDEVTALLESNGIAADLSDERFTGRPIEFKFHGALRPEQEEAAHALSACDIGVLSASTAFGKTVLGAWMIAERKTNTLVLVHRRQLMDQWRERLSVFLDLPAGEIGQIGAGKNKATGNIDIAVIQSLNQKGEVRDIVADYGQVIVDECHHLPAFSFERVLREVRARFVLGLTATPIRKDGHHPIIVMQCGPVLWRDSAKTAAEERPFNHVVLPRLTSFRLGAQEGELSIQEIYGSLVADAARNDQIVADVGAAVKAGRSPLVLTERKEHVEYLAERLSAVVENVIVLRGGAGAKQRRAAAEQLKNVGREEARVVIATGRYVGEGFDDDRLDTLFLTMPIAWRGTLQQYAGRLHRLNDDKQEVRIYDYVDAEVPVLRRMFDKRFKGYGAMGYSVSRESVSP